MQSELCLTLASTSKFRQQLLQKLQLPFQCVAPAVDETPLSGESGPELAVRLAIAKARAVGQGLTSGLVIGSDQVAVNGADLLGKPGNYERAFAQLKAASGRCVTFYTGLCLYNAATGNQQSLVAPFRVQFRTLSDRQIRNYLDKEQPFDCAGSFMCEGLGIALFERLEGDDPNTLVGLPLISLVTMLEREGVRVLG